MDCAQLFSVYRFYEHVGPFIQHMYKTSPRQTLQNNTIKKNIISNAGLEPHQFSGQKYYGMCIMGISTE